MFNINYEIVIRKLGLNGGLTTSLPQLYVIFLVSMPLSLLLFLMFTKYKHSKLVDLGFHKWIIK